MGRAKGQYVPTDNINYEYIEEVIKEEGYNYKQLSKALGWGQNGISNMLRKEHAVHTEKLEQLAALLRRNVTAFYIPGVVQEEQTEEEETLHLLRLILDELKTMNDLIAGGGLKK